MKVNRINKWFVYLGGVIVLVYACKDSKNTNHLSFASSPYLRQDADNPVNWYEWGDEALLRARKENKPLLVSIGYASCHWCHVMEKESFMDTAVARIMNDNFVCIKVDREERPDIDNIYMNACQLISGTGGWPLNAFALPDGKPFFAGTFYTNPGWINLVRKIAVAYKEQNKIVIQQVRSYSTSAIIAQNNLFKSVIIFIGQANHLLFDMPYCVFYDFSVEWIGSHGNTYLTPRPPVRKVVLTSAANCLSDILNVVEA